MSDGLLESDVKSVMAGKNGHPRRSYSLGVIAKADLLLNASSRFDDDSGEVAGDWNHIQDTCKGDWYSFMQFDGEWVEVIVVFADDADAEAFEASWGMGA